jgi:hypothetical protein
MSLYAKSAALEFGLMRERLQKEKFDAENAKARLSGL